ncbi:MAG: polysaccharide biosynthesis protein [Patiriisocius sp.]|uniref:polysaccharide biosynthesis protein n=1 Tax=Patiriisocius sp. TaxID=2822396 RepID=UPI003EF58CC3
MKSIEKSFSALYTGDNRLKLLDQRYLPRWIVVVLDLLLCACSLAIVYFILLGTPIFFSDYVSLPTQGLFLLGVNLLFFFIFKTYSGIIRHSTFTDIIKLAFSSIGTAFTLLVFNTIYGAFTDKYVYTLTLIVMYMFLSFSLLLLFRVAVKETYQILKRGAKGILKKRVAIIGADDQTISLAKALTTESNLPFKLVGFLTEKFDSKRYKLLGKPVIPIKGNFPETVQNYNIQGVIVISDSLAVKEKNEIVALCLENNVEVLNVPSVERWNTKDDIHNQIKPIQIEDLLERDPINIENEAIANDLVGKTILVTGGAGSIGSEIVRQIALFNPKLVVILDQAESALHELELYLVEKFPDLNFITELANISNMYRLEQLFTKYDFNMVYHAAAYKHVPLIERNPHEAVYVNILGTVNLAVLSVSNKIDKFVMISTDKAVNPTNVMGASKRVAEMYVQSLQRKEKIHTRFITTRFGNVLGSNGSVIPHFRRQIAAGGPVTVTHKDIIRYFMTIPEACQLVLQAGTMGSGGEIFVFDMGKPIKILDMAERMIKLSGLEPYIDININITGLRPGEKLYEELLNDTSTSLPTPHPKIMISEVPTVSFDIINTKVKKIIKTATRFKDNEVVILLKELVPEYISENSRFEVLDTEKKDG